MKTFFTVVATAIATIAILVTLMAVYDAATPRVYKRCISSRVVSLNGEATTGEASLPSPEQCDYVVLP